MVREGAVKAAKPRARASAKSSRKSPQVAPSKFRARAEGRGLPPKVALIGAAGAVIIAGGVALFTGDRLQQASEGLKSAVAGQLGHAGFAVTSLKIKGASPAASAAIAAAAGLQKDDPILGVDLEALRQRVEAVGWVEKASVRRLLPHTLMIEVTERPPAAVWQAGGILRVIDKQGKVIAEANPRSYPHLPLLVGAGANGTGAEVLALVSQRPRLAERLEAMVRVDDRRWDLRLKDGTLIQLPAAGEDSALIALDALDQKQRVLDLGLGRIDLRSPEMVVVRRREAPVSADVIAGGV
jgi:cell division protein FtsQ